MNPSPPPSSEKTVETQPAAKGKKYAEGVLLGTALGVLIQLGGYLLTRGDGSEFGVAMFIVAPLVSGFAVAAVVRRPKRIAACCLTGGLITVSILLFTGWEGYICCLMSLPLVAAGVALGAWIGYLTLGRRRDGLPNPAVTMVLLLLICPLLIAGADRVERPFRSMQKEVFTTEAIISAPPERVWELVGQMHKLDGPRPFLLRIGLPTPRRCELDKAGVGGRRVCYFDSGIIAQEVTDWRAPSFMGLRITENTLPGRHWLTFIDASYELIPTADGKQTKVVRHTTIGTRLFPRWYWRPLERWGVTSEHEFVFANLQRWAEGQ